MRSEDRHLGTWGSLRRSSRFRSIHSSAHKALHSLRRSSRFVVPLAFARYTPPLANRSTRFVVPLASSFLSRSLDTRLRSIHSSARYAIQTNRHRSDAPRSTRFREFRYTPPELSPSRVYGDTFTNSQDRYDLADTGTVETFGDGGDGGCADTPELDFVHRRSTTGAFRSLRLKKIMNGLRVPLHSLF